MSSPLEVVAKYSVGQLAALVAKVGDDNVQAILRGTVEVVVKKISYIVRSFQVVIDYGKNLQEMIDEGTYDYVNPSITAEHFPVKGDGKQEQEIFLFHLSRSIGFDDAIKEMATAGYRPVTIEELLALGKVQPELQRQFPIVAFGSVLRLPGRRHYVAYLGGYDFKRDLALDCVDGSWAANCRFAAIRNAS